MLTIGGTGFANGATVTLSGSAAQVRSVSSGSISAVTPAVPSGGAVDVVVTNPDGQNARLSQGFTYVVIARPSIARLSGGPGSTLGGAAFAIAGTGFQSGAAVRFGGVAAAAALVEGELLGTTPAHAAGTVDVTVTNPDGQSDTVIGGFTYVEPDSLDFNGEWEGLGTEGEATLRFTIRDNLLTDVSCSLSSTGVLTSVMSPQSPVSRGAVSAAGANGSFTGRIVTRTSAIGSLRVGQCAANEINWFALKPE